MTPAESTAYLAPVGFEAELAHELGALPVESASARAINKRRSVENPTTARKLSVLQIHLRARLWHNRGTILEH
ncbi:MAG: hypothetical protein FJX42_04855 [Alphaproteobacteria bacterium]|nr:hypothetical protein [Alphaproteobacteria bacterium]